MKKLTKEGYQVQLYSYKNYVQTKFSDSAKSKLGWIAQYYTNCTYEGTYNGWQYTDSGIVAGINSQSVDVSVFKKTSNRIFDHLELETSEPLIVEEGSTPDLSNLVV